MKAAVYARVSSAIQRDNHTIDSQLRALPEYVSRQGWELVGSYVDDGHSAAAGKLAARTGLQALLADAAAGRFEVVAVVDLDRLTRSEDLTERGAILGAFQRAGVQIAETATGMVHDLRESQGDLLVGLRAFFGAEENRKRRERSVRGKIEAARKGRKPSGPTPFGLRYNKVTGAFSICEEEAAVVREIFERVAAGESCAALELDFNARGVLLSGHGRRNQASYWVRERIYKLVTSPTYRGEWTVDKARRLVITVPPIVDAALWYAAHDALKRWGRSGLRRTKYVYLCEAIATCALCGGRIGISSHSATPRPYRRNSYYVCSYRRRPRLGEERCMLPMRRVDEVDGRLWASVYELLTSRWDELAALVVEHEARQTQHAGRWAEELAEHTRRLAQLDKAESAILARFRQGRVSERALDAELEHVGRERHALHSQIEIARAAAAPSRASTLDELRSAVDALRDELRDAPPAIRRDLVRALVPGDDLHRVVLGASSIQATVAIAPARLRVVGQAAYSYL